MESSTLGLASQFELAKAKLLLESTKDLQGLKELCLSLMQQNFALRELYADLYKSTLPDITQWKKESVE
jgi:hypothetical protein